MRLLLLLTLLLSPLALAQDKTMYRHIVLFKFKDSAKAEQITEIEKSFVALPSKVKTITDFEWGKNVSPENLNQGLTHCFVVTFKNKKDLEDYLVDPAHKAFVEKLLPILDKATVVDFVPEK
ncbi:hypothetical protein Rhal01_00958 [Rubritalea halochordaticola]|uniref:Stress-response A/B barrel domain-containing protein n=1 Tax=Rubritalea halochordaticola TaxID=714537 RepID=A0ABP9UZK4_9BACT